MILFFELAVLLLALRHDCQSCACSTNVHPKSSTNVFVPPQHQPPVPDLMPDWRDLLSCACGFEKERKTAREREWGKEVRRQDDASGTVVEAEELKKVEVCWWWFSDPILFSVPPSWFYFWAVSVSMHHILPGAKSIGNESLPVMSLLSLWFEYLCASPWPQQDSIKFDWSTLIHLLGLRKVKL